MPMRLGMLGVWHPHAPGMAKQIAAHPDEFALVGAYDPDAALLARRAAEWRPFAGDLRTFASPEELLSQKLDGVVVEGVVADNLRFARTALEGGLPVLLEKPFGCRIAETREAFALAR